MMRTGIVHLSDIHFHEESLPSIVEDQMNALAGAMASLRANYGITEVIIIITGDIAYSGKQSEYEHAVRMLDLIRNKMQEAKIISYFLLIPGNHDCDFKKDSRLRRTVLASMVSNLDEDLADRSIIEPCISIQEAFWTFASLYHVHVSKINGLYAVVTIDIAGSGQKVVAHLLNSAWISKLPEEQGAMRFPVHVIDNNPAEKTANLVFASMHHPSNWLMSSNGKALVNRFMSTVDFVLTGHEHESDNFGRVAHGGKLTFIEGGVLSDAHNITSSHFNLLIADLSEYNYDLYVYSWNQESRAYLPRKEIEEQTYRNKSRKQDGYHVYDKYKQDFLHDLGVAFTHPHRQTIALRDLFVYPDFREFSLAPSSASMDTIFGQRIINYILRNKRVLIMGADQSGKTSLAKIIFEELASKSLIPLIVNGRDFTGKSDTNIRETISKSYNQQYENPHFAVYMQEPINRRVIILDDYHKIKHIGIQMRTRIVNILCEIAETVIILGSHEAMLDEFSNPDVEQNALLLFSYCTILEFGRVRQSELIRRWYYLGRDGEVEDVRAERERQAAQAERAILAALSQDFVPADPIIILGMLYQIETQTSLDISCSSHGHLFDVLVKTNLGVAKYDPADFNSRFTYLSELAFFMYERKNFRLDRAQQQEWQQWYASVYRPPFDCEHLVNDLIQSQVLTSRNGELSFRYKYHYYYFVGRYFADHISEDETRAQMVRMCQRLHNEDSANIIMFICHFSRDKFIIRTIIDIAKSFFNSYPKCRLEDDIKPLNESIIKSLPSRDLHLSADNNPTENRRRLLEEQDRSGDMRLSSKSGDQICSVDQQEEGHDVSEEKEREEKEKQLEDEALHTNAAFKTIQILGQTLRSFYGSMRNDERLEIARECFSLGLRVLSFYAKIVTDSEASLHDSFVALISAKREHLQPDEVNHLAERFILGLAEFFSFAVIKHITGSVGTQRLSETFVDLLKEESSNAFRLIDLSIRLDNYPSFPLSETRALAKDVRDNPLAWALLRRFIWQHFYLYDENYRLAQQVCQLVDISYESTRLLPPSTKRDK